MKNSSTSQSTARERVLSAAEKLFMERGYGGTSMRDIADVLNVKQPALYYHVKSKDELFFLVLERHLARHQQGLVTVTTQAGPDLRAQLRAIVHWLVAELPMNIDGMVHVDIPALADPYRQQANDLLWQSFFLPIGQVFADAQRRGEIRKYDPYMLAGAVFSLASGARYPADIGATERTAVAMSDELMDVLLDGLWLR